MHVNEYSPSANVGLNLASKQDFLCCSGASLGPDDWEGADFFHDERPFSLHSSPKNKQMIRTSQKQEPPQQLTPNPPVLRTPWQMPACVISKLFHFYLFFQKIMGDVACPT